MKTLHPAAREWLDSHASAWEVGTVQSWERFHAASLALIRAERVNGLLLARNLNNQVINPDTGRVSP